MFPRHLVSPLLAIVMLLGCATQPAVTQEGGAAAIHAVLDDFHEAAASANEQRYFAHFSDASVFLGTDATERWDKAAFLTFAHPHFANGKGWTFEPGKRNVFLSTDGRTAWFDETLKSASYGECRGTGVLQRYGAVWKIEQYNLTIPIPNDLAEEFVARIRKEER